MKTIWKILIAFGLIVWIALTAIMLGFLFTKSEIFSELPIGNKVAIIPIKGEITYEGCSGGIFGSPQCAQVGEIKKMLKDAEDDSSVRAVVLDINSGGGSVVASSEMMNSVKNFKKPVVAHISETGASGAYYVASAADRIVADRDSITGSIGVIMSISHYYDLFGKLGINVTVIKSGKSKDIGSPYREMTDEEKTELKGKIDKIYYNLVSDIAENRNLSVSYVENISDGSIYLGSEAKTLGLIDSIGGIDDAINLAGELGNIKGKPGIKEIRTKSNNFMDILNAAGYYQLYNLLNQ